MESRVQTVCLVVLTTIAVAGSLFYLRPVLIPFVLAVFLALALSAVVEFQCQRLKVPRLLAQLATLGLGGLAFLMVAGIVSASVEQLRANSAAYLGQLSQLTERLRGALQTRSQPASRSSTLKPSRRSRPASSVLYSAQPRARSSTSSRNRSSLESSSRSC